MGDVAGVAGAEAVIEPPGDQLVVGAEEPARGPADAPVVIVPVGSIGQHGPHCPMDVDISAPFHMAAEVARRVEAFPVIVAPPVWSGFTHYNMGFAGTISLRLETFQSLIADICRSIHANGFHRIITVNGHGGNAAPCRAVSWQLAEEDIFTLSFNWWDMVEAELREWSATDRKSTRLNSSHW